MELTRGWEFLIAVLLLGWWIAQLHTTVYQHKFMLGAPLFPIGVLSLHYFLLTLESVGFRENLLLRVELVRAMLTLLAVTQIVILLNGRLVKLCSLMKSWFTLLSPPR